MDIEYVYQIEKIVDNLECIYVNELEKQTKNHLHDLKTLKDMVIDFKNSMNKCFDELNKKLEEQDKYYDEVRKRIKQRREEHIERMKQKLVDN